MAVKKKKKFPKPDYKSDDGSIRLYCADCMDVLPKLPRNKIHAVITDPPYGIGYSSNYTGPTTTATWMNKEISGDESVALRDRVLSQFTNWVCFGSFKSEFPQGYKSVLIWDKGPASGMGDLKFPWKQSFELVFVAGRGWKGKRDEGVLKGYNIVTRKSMGRKHPNEKPVDLLRHFVSKSSDDMILDPFMGVGPTGVACVQEGRKFVGIECEREYFDISVERIEQALSERQE